jgi:25S rRNA (uracil2634-N3)-methyltransferase
VKGFLRSANDMLSKNGEAHVTHKTAHPFDRWEIEKLAEDVGLCLIEKSEFFRWDFPGYCNKRGEGDRADDSFPVGDCCTFKFGRSQG